MKALVFGGAFNPPSRAHIDLAYHAMQESQSDCVIFVPSKMSYIKKEQGKDYAFRDEDRLSMLNKIAENKDWMIVSDFEIHSDTQPRTYLTLQHLKEEGYSCRLLIGYDKLIELETNWQYIPEIMHEFGVVAMDRYEDDCISYIAKDPYLSGFASCIQVVHTPDIYHSVSSTQIRRKYMEIRNELKTLKDMVPEELEGLYAYLNR